jgi:hypothetical protein
MTMRKEDAWVATTFYVSDDTKIDVGYNPDGGTTPVSIGFGFLQRGNVLLTVEAARKLRYELAALLMDMDVAAEIREDDCDGCGHPMNEHDNEGCTGWTAGTMCLCQEIP